MIEVRIHGRGGQGTVTASRILAEAVYLDGKFSQAIPMYGTERRGAPVTAFVRIDDVRVRERDLVHEPDIVFVLDPLLGKRPAVIEGLKTGGLLIVNFPHPPEKVPLEGDFKIATVDATKIALETLKNPITNTAILGAFSKITGLVNLESIEKAVLHRFPGRIGQINIAAVKRSYNEVSELVSAKKQALKQIDDEGPLTGGGYGVLRNVASWRIFRPVINQDKCTGCKFCWIYCPETAFKWLENENKPEIEYRKCKGCEICVNECPVEAIEWRREEI